MTTRVRILTATIALAVVAGLSFSHWYAYQKGSANQARALSGMAPDELRTAVHMMKLHDEDPSEFTKESLQWWQVRLSASIPTTEAFALPAARRSGNEQLVADLEGLLQSGRKLQSASVGR